jgi:hypothetical protein
MDATVILAALMTGIDETVTVGVLIMLTEPLIVPVVIEAMVTPVALSTGIVETVTVGVPTTVTVCVPPGVNATTLTGMVDWSVATTTGNDLAILVCPNRTALVVPDAPTTTFIFCTCEVPTSSAAIVGPVPVLTIIPSAILSPYPVSVGYVIPSINPIGIP